MDIIILLIQSLWFIIPAYAANGFPPLMRGKHPIDQKRSFRSKRILGDGKTWEGTLGGIIAGMAIGSLQIAFQSDLKFLGLNLPPMTLPLVIALCIGTMAGDILGSFIKRRLNIKRGDSAPLMDQEGFLVLAILFAMPFYNLNAIIVVTLLIITPPIHWLANIGGFYLKFKKTPW